MGPGGRGGKDWKCLGRYGEVWRGEGSLNGRFLCINDRATMMGRKSGTEEREKIELNIKTKFN